MAVWLLYSSTNSKTRDTKHELNTDFARTLTYEDYDDETEQRLKLMYAAIEKLNEIEKALVFLYLEDKAYREIAATLGISEVNARVKMNRVKTKLKKLLN